MATQKIAFVTDDGEKISAHFGRAQYYQVFTIEDGTIVAEEQREKLGHNDFVNEPHDADRAGGRHDHEHGMGRHSQSKHARMIAAIPDVAVLVARGMGRGAHLNLQEANITPILTDLTDIKAAVEAYINGTLDNRADRVH